MSFRIAFYKGTRPGLAGVYNRAVRSWTAGPYSHAELIFSDGLSGSSSFEDGGVRLKEIKYDPVRWDILDLPPEWELAARMYFETHAKKVTKYDLLGNARFLFGPIKHSEDRLFCSEAIADALRLETAWRYEPNVLYSTVKRMAAVHRLARMQICTSAQK